MKILVISRNAWDDTNSIGNTLSNFFGGIPNVELANIYFRSSTPNNNICQRYYRVTETEVLKKWFFPQTIGTNFMWNQKGRGQSQNAATKNERTLIRIVHKYNLKHVYKFSDYIWYSQKWINRKLKTFVESFQPDIIFTFVKSSPQYYLTVKYLRKNFHIPLFSWIADDEYTGLVTQHSVKAIGNLRYILKESAVIRGCSTEICDYYNSIFGCKASALYKGCDLSVPVKEYVNCPVKIVYAGNLLYGRFDILCKIVDILEKTIGIEDEVCFEIYSNTQLSIEEQRFLEQKRCVKYMGRRDYEVILQQLITADIVLHIESFEKEQILKTKYSFSTKIIDCLQSGSVLLAVGPEELASIKYVKQIPGTYVIDNLDLLAEELKAILNDTGAYGERAKKIREYALKYHESSCNKQEVKSLMQKIIRGES